jgi:hypothetical protein
MEQPAEFNRVVLEFLNSLLHLAQPERSEA